MWITPAYAQAGAAGSGDFLISILPFALIFVIIYFLMIRPQQKKIKDHQNMVSAIRRGDTVVTGGGLVGKVTRVIDDAECMVEIAEGVRVKVVKATVADVRAKGEPASDAKGAGD